MNGFSFGAFGVGISFTKQSVGWGRATFQGSPGWLILLGHINVCWLPTNKFRPHAEIF